MKKLIYVAAIFLFLNITGCYTVIWSPGMDFPTSDRTSDYDSSDTTGYYGTSEINSDIYDDVYYNEPYYGHYADYYNIPWWYSIPPSTVTNNHNKNNGKATANSSGDVSPIRNSGNGRGNSGRSSGDIINTPPVTVSGSGSTSSGTSTTNTEPKKTDSGSENTRHSSSSGSVRNNDGNRNDGGRK
jgi:hypothetical protein